MLLKYAFNYIRSFTHKLTMEQVLKSVMHQKLPESAEIKASNIIKNLELIIYIISRICLINFKSSGN